MDIIGALIFLIFIVFPAVAIFGFTSRVTTGVYHWADKQHPEPIYDYEPQHTEREHKVTAISTVSIPNQTVDVIDNTKEDFDWEAWSRQRVAEARAPSEAELMRKYAGHSKNYEDSARFKKRLDSETFDVRDYLKK